MAKSPIERKQAPIKNILRLEYTTLKITIEALDAEAHVGAFMLAGHIAEQCRIFYGWGFPKMSIDKIALCPQCKQEASLKMIDIIGIICPHCGADLKGDLEI